MADNVNQSETAAACLRRSPVLELYREHVTVAGNHRGMAIAMNGPAIEPERNALVDISAVPKRLVVGNGASAWLMHRGAKAPEVLFSIDNSRNGALIVRIHYDQYLLIDNLAGGGLDDCFTARVGSYGDTLVLPYESAEFALAGPVRSALLRELSSVDPATLEAGQWVATRLANAEVALHVVETPHPHLRIVCTSADARYLFGVLRDIVLENNGLVTSIDAYLDFVTAASAGPRG